MIQFVKLIRSLDQALGNLEKKNLIKEYFQNALLLKNENTTKNLNKVKINGPHFFGQYISSQEKSLIEFSALNY